MLTPSTMELMHRLDRPMPALAQPMMIRRNTGPVLNVPRFIASLNGALADVEVAFAEWVEAAESYAAAVVLDCAGQDLSADDRSILKDALVRAEEAVARDVESFTKERKRIHRVIQRIPGMTPIERRTLLGINRRYLTALSKTGAIKWDIVWVLRSLVAETHPGRGKGVTFDDPKALEAYLRAAIA